MRNFARFLTLCVILLAVSQAGFGQAITATMTGTVVDGTKAVVPNATITLTNELSGDVRKSVTNAAGYYTIAAVPAGTYTLLVEATGFQKSSQKGIVFNSSDKRNIETEMQVGAVTQTVEVSGQTDALATIQSGEKSQVLDTEILQNIAVVGRSAAEFIKIMPGFAQTGNGVTNSPGFSGEVIGINGNGNAGRQSALGYFSANGTPTASMEIVSDGAHVSDPGCNCATPVNPNGEMVQEVRVMQAAFTAENSKGPVVINTVTKAGGTSYHGEGYVSARNYVLNANNWINNRNGLGRAENKYFFPGGNIGGPVLIPGTNFNKNRDKLFFFGGFEYFYQHLTSGQIQTNVPTDAMRNGDFSTASVAAAYAGSSGVTAAKEASFPGGQVPASQFDKGGVAAMNLLPKPNANPAQSNGFNFIQQVNFPQNGYQAVGREDYSISDNTKLFVRYYHQQELQTFPIQLWGQAGNQVPYPTAVLGNNHSESIAGDLTHVFSPSLTNEFIVAYTYVGFPNTFENPEAVSRAKAGFPYAGFFKNGNPYIPNLSVANSQGALLSNGGGFQAGRNGVYYANKPLGSIADNFTKLWQTHTVKIGFYTEFYANFQPANGAAQGTYTFAGNNPSGSGNAYADMLLGRISNFSQVNFNVVNRASSTLAEGYVQDSWKVSRRLNIDYGIRFQHDPQARDRYDVGRAVWNPATYVNSTTAVLPGILWHKIDPTIPNEGYPTRTVYYAPRFAMSLDPLGTGKTIIRGGIGLYRYRGPTGAGNTSAQQGSFTRNLTDTTNQGSTMAAIDAAQPAFYSSFGTSQSLVDRYDDQLSLTYTYNFTISQRLPFNSNFDVAYVGTLGRHLNESAMHNINAVPYGTFLNVANPNAAVYNNYRPMPNYADVNISSFDNYSNYDALQSTFVHRSTRYTVQMNYTFSKTLGGATIDTLNWANNYGPLAFDRRHIFNAAYSVKLGSPVKNKLLGGVANGWSVSGIMQLQSGAILQLNSTNNRFNMTLPSGVTNLNITGTNSVPAMPRLTCNPTSNLGPNQFVNGNCFALPTAGNNGPIIEPGAYGPSFFNTDLSLFKTFKFSEHKSLQFRVEGFNFLNRANYTFGQDNNLNLVFNSAGVQTNSLFGTTTNKIGNRIIQLAAKFYF